VADDESAHRPHDGGWVIDLSVHPAGPVLKSKFIDSATAAAAANSSGSAGAASSGVRRENFTYRSSLASYPPAGARRRAQVQCRSPA
jgi:hypothetical protein